MAPSCDYFNNQSAAFDEFDEEESPVCATPMYPCNVLYVLAQMLHSEFNIEDSSMMVQKI